MWIYLDVYRFIASFCCRHIKNKTWQRLFPLYNYLLKHIPMDLVSEVILEQSHYTMQWEFCPTTAFVQSFATAMSRQQQSKTILGRTPLHHCNLPRIGLAKVWELLCYNRECVNIQNGRGWTALQDFEHVQTDHLDYWRERSHWWEISGLFISIASIPR